jgi:hypothetical protein
MMATGGLLSVYGLASCLIRLSLMATSLLDHVRGPPPRHEDILQPRLTFAKLQPWTRRACAGAGRHGRGAAATTECAAATTEAGAFHLKSVDGSCWFS